jgi:D-3-phosphoglycerate dehydrogenase
MKILVPEIIAQSGRDYLLQHGYKIEDSILFSKEQLKEAVRDCDGLLIRIMKCDRDVLQEAGKLKVIAKHGIGVDNIDVEYCTQANIQITFTPLAVCNAVAEHTLFLMMGCAKRVMITIRGFVDKGDFSVRNREFGIELAGKTVGILGLGRIGCSLAKKCSGLDMKVIGFDPYVNQDNHYIEMMDRDSVIKNADFLSLNLPCTDETQGSFGKREFSMMKKSAYFINASRGKIVQESELIIALQTHEIMGAGIDVFEDEPPIYINPLLHMDNVFVTPHYAGSTVETSSLVALHAAIGIDEVLSGKAISWPLNKLKGRKYK